MGAARYMLTGRPPQESIPRNLIVSFILIYLLCMYHFSSNNQRAKLQNANVSVHKQAFGLYLSRQAMNALCIDQLRRACQQPESPPKIPVVLTCIT